MTQAVRILTAEFDHPPTHQDGADKAFSLEEKYAAALRRIAALEEDNRTLRGKNRELIGLADMDALTGLCNRGYFNRALTQSCYKPAEEDTDVILMIDLNGFKKINDTYGHDAGDAALILVAENLRANVRGSDVVARLGGDEFAVLLRGFDKTEALARHKQINDMFRNLYFTYKEDTIQVRGSVGFWPIDRNLTRQDNLNAADMMMYHEKAASKSTNASVPVAALG